MSTAVTVCQKIYLTIGLHVMFPYGHDLINTIPSADNVYLVMQQGPYSPN